MGVALLHASAEGGAVGIVNYLMESVADSGGKHHCMKASTAYYAGAGTPVGRWMGSGLSGLSGGGLSRLSLGEEVTADDLLSLLGDFTNPLSGEVLGRKVMEKSVPGVSGESVLDKVVAARQKAHRSVHGFDFTFSPCKDVSVLWGLGSDEVRDLIYEAHKEAVSYAVGLMEERAVYTRTGAGGAVRVKARGLVAAGFDHWDSRENDPHLHTHVVAVNRVQGPDGKWRTIDSKGLLPSMVAVSEAYDSKLMDLLEQRLGVGWVRVSETVGGKPVFGIAGLDRAVVEEFSSRRYQILDERSGAVPGRADDQRSWSSTRKAKKHFSFDELRAAWVERAGGEVSVPQAQTRSSVFDFDVAVETVLNQLESGRSTWTKWNVQAEAHRVLREFSLGEDREHLVDEVTQVVLDCSVSLDQGVLPQNVVADGVARFNSAGHERFTSGTVLSSEAALIEGLDVATCAVDMGEADTFLTAWESKEGFNLSASQVGAVFEIATDGRGIDLLVGPAGAGKTTALEALTALWREQGGSVTGFAPSAAAARVLAESTGKANTLASWVAHPYSFAAGELVIVDEAAMAGTISLAQLAEATHEAGAKLLLVGDNMQLSAVEAGGGFGLLARRMVEPPSLSEVRRFKEPWEATASLGLRKGTDKAIAAYYEHSRILGGGTTESVLPDVVDAWKKDLLNGKETIMLAADNETASLLAARAREFLVDTHQVDDAKTVGLRDGNRAGAGDLVVSRLNERRTHECLINGATWRVVAALNDGRLKVESLDHPGVNLVLESGYVRDNVELAYAGTVHRSQGRTVDTVHTVVTESMSRSALYVAMTRGRAGNTAWCITDVTNVDGNQIDETDPLDVFTRVMGQGTQEKAAIEILSENVNPGFTGIVQEYNTLASYQRGLYWAGAMESKLSDAQTTFTGVGGARLTQILDYQLERGFTVDEVIQYLVQKTSDDDSLVEVIQNLPYKETDGVVDGLSPYFDEDTSRILSARLDMINNRLDQELIRSVKERQPWVMVLLNDLSDVNNPEWRENIDQVLFARLQTGHEDVNIALPDDASQKATAALVRLQTMHVRAVGSIQSPVMTGSVSLGI